MSTKGVRIGLLTVSLLSVLLLLFFMFWTQRFTNSTYEIKGYVSSALHRDIPVPANARLIESAAYSDHPTQSRSETYELKHIGGEQGLYPPEAYFQKLHDAGWTELKDERMGNVHILNKAEVRIAIEIQENTFRIFLLHSDQDRHQNLG
ncbi:hypothetical protein M3629_02675 [Paenibacillus polysaccharolyticus]|uniref:hypothetical protein n=1 Tax=Paenibacillus polysaccharolyticus TaxID=582692 RepID=UPI00204158F5|nr:hypothetical protein [Paenibacillus polysaccharolyticus]MCM3131670.1 hypothetical protein [Paenibacillus polysaccharolyticus]